MSNIFLFYLTDEEAFYCYPDKLRLPLIFYFGHTAVVYVNKMILAGLIQVNKIIEFMWFIPKKDPAT